MSIIFAASITVVSLLTLIFGSTESNHVALAETIAAGQEKWVQSGPTSEDFQVDIGKLRQVGDQIYARCRRQLTGSALEHARAGHVKINIPDNSTEWMDAAFTCGDIPTERLVKASILSPSGQILFSRRGFSSRSSNEAANSYFLYNRNVAGLVCWSAARKCQGKDLQWPPPKDVFDRWPPPRGGKVDAFVPSCNLRP